MQAQSPDNAEVKQPWWIPSWSMLTWVIIFSALAMLVPTEWIVDVQDRMIPEAPRPERAFTPDAASLDAALQAGKPAPGADKMLVELQVRRIAQAGPLAGDHIPRLMTTLRHMNQLASIETTLAGKRAVWIHHARLISRDLGRLDPMKVTRALERLHTQLSTPASSP